MSMYVKCHYSSNLELRRPIQGRGTGPADILLTSNTDKIITKVFGSPVLEHIS